MIYLDIESDHPSANSEPDPAEDRIISLALVHEGHVDVGVDGWERERYINPGFPLTRTAVHNITDEMLSGQPAFHAVAKSLCALLETELYICTFNGARYDVPLLHEEFSRVGIDWHTDRHRFIDLAILWRKMEPRTLADACRRFAGREHEDAHAAISDARVLPDILRGMMLAFPEVQGKGLDQLADMSTPSITIGGEDLPLVDLGGLFARDRDGDLVYTHKRVRGTKVCDDQGYGSWLARKFPLLSHSAAILYDALGIVEDGHH